MLRSWVWEQGSFKFQLRCPFGCRAEEVRIGEPLDVLGLLEEMSHDALCQRVCEELLRVQVRCGACGVRFSASDSALAQFKPEFLEWMDDTWRQGIKAHYGLRGTIERKLARSGRGGCDEPAERA